MRTLTIILTTFLLSAPLTPAAADHGQGHAHGKSMVQCPSCKSGCELHVDKGRETKSCWEIEFKPICIPRVTFPWQYKRCACGSGKSDGKCCGHAPLNGARVKTVRKLKKVEYECAKCKYTWKPICPGCDKSGKGPHKGSADHPAAHGEVPTPATANGRPNLPFIRIIQ